MKYLKIIILIVALIIGAVFVYVSMSPPKSPLDSASFKNELHDLEVVYSRPYKKGRLIFGDAENEALVPYGKYWRTGANAATTFMTSSDITFGEKEISAGKYRLYSIPGPKSWSIFLNTEPDKYFAIMEPDKTKDLIELVVNSFSTDDLIEQFTIDFANDSTGVSLNLKWDTTLISIPIK